MAHHQGPPVKVGASRAAGDAGGRRSRWGRRGCWSRWGRVRWLLNRGVRILSRPPRFLGAHPPFQLLRQRPRLRHLLVRPRLAAELPDQRRLVLGVYIDYFLPAPFGCIWRLVKRRNGLCALLLGSAAETFEFWALHRMDHK